MARPYRIGFDARLAGQKHAGIGRYSEELLRALIEEAGPQVEWCVFTFDEEQLPWLENFSHVQRRVTPIRHYTVKEQLLLGRNFAKEKLDLLHVPHFNVPLGYSGKFVVTIHDLLWHRQRDARATTLSPWVYRVKFLGYKFVTARAIKKAEHILVPSQTVAKEIQEIIPHTVPVLVTSEGMSATYLRQPEVGKQKRGSKKKERAPYCVYTGSLYPHKNVEVILQALRLLPHWRVKLVSSRSVFTEEVLLRAKALQIEEQVEWLGYQSDDDLIALYQEAEALIQPSLSEGFGLTGLEAMAAGCAVVASDIPVFHEVYKEHAQYFDPHSAEKLAELLGKIEKHPPSLKELEQAQKHAHSFTWQKTAKKVWQTYRQVLSQNE